MSLTPEKIAASAPDQAALTAASKLLKPNLWPLLVARGGLVWGECQGSGSSPYRVVADEADFGAKCTCPSRKFPCKHGLALLWLRAEGKLPFSDAEPPDWVGQWLGRRRGKPAGATPLQGTNPIASIDAIPVDPRPVSVSKLEARAAAQRERTRNDRETSILNSLDELDRWILDQLDRGLASFIPIATAQCRLAAQRLVDAKAGGIANMLDRIPGELFKIPEQERPDYLIERLGSLHLLAEAYRRQEMLPHGLRADVRQLVGWNIAKDDLGIDDSATVIDGDWLVVATRAETQPDKLRRLETWLLKLDAESPSRFALLMDFVPASTGASGSGRMIGEILSASLTFYPSAIPLRAVIRQLRQTTISKDVNLSPEPLDAALNRYGEALSKHPWLGPWPMLVRGARVVRQDSALWLTDAEGSAGLAVDSGIAEKALPLAGLGPIDICALWDGRSAWFGFADTPLGRWQPA